MKAEPCSHTGTCFLSSQLQQSLGGAGRSGRHQSDTRQRPSSESRSIPTDTAQPLPSLPPPPSGQTRHCVPSLGHSTSMSLPRGWAVEGQCNTRCHGERLLRLSCHGDGDAAQHRQETQTHPRAGAYGRGEGLRVRERGVAPLLCSHPPENSC